MGSRVLRPARRRRATGAAVATTARLAATTATAATPPSWALVCFFLTACSATFCRASSFLVAIYGWSTARTTVATAARSVWAGTGCLFWVLSGGRLHARWETGDAAPQAGQQPRIIDILGQSLWRRRWGLRWGRGINLVDIDRRSACPRSHGVLHFATFRWRNTNCMAG